MIQSDTYRKNPVIANPPFGGCGNLSFLCCQVPSPDSPPTGGSSPLPLQSSPRRRGPSIVGRVPQKPDKEFNVGQDPCDPDILLSRRGGFSLPFLIPFLFLFLIGCHSDPIGTSGESQPTIVGGTITSDTTWLATNGPYLVTEDLTVPVNVSWIVEEGTEIAVAWNKSITINGWAYLGGYPNQPIVFNSDKGVWRGLKITGHLYEGDSTGGVILSSVVSADIYNTVNAVLCVDSAYVFIYDSRIVNCDSVGVLVDSGAVVDVQSCDFINDRTLNILDPVAIWSVFGGSIRVYYTRITDFNHGIRFQGGRYLTHIESNILTTCDVGVLCDSQDSLEITDNEFRDCQTGILITQGSPLITYNTFEKMDKCVEVKGSCQPEAHYNSFVDTDRWAWVNNSPYDVNATYNWWGTTDPDSIDQLIYDHNDDPDYGTVHYEPFLTSAP